MKTNLFEITNDIIELIGKFEEAEGEITEELSNQFNITKGELQNKALGYRAVILNAEGDNETIDKEIKRLQALKKKNNTLIDVLKFRLLGAVNLFGDFKAGTCTFKTRKSTSVLIEDSELLPKKYFVKKVTVSVDKKQIATALKEGKKVKGASLQENLNLKIN